MTSKQFTIAPERKSPPDALEGAITWQQALSSSPDAAIWLLAPRELWTMAGRATMAAAGIDEVGDEECRSTWVEICGQAVAAVASGITADIGREVTAGKGAEQDNAPGGTEWTVFSIRTHDGEVFRLRAAWSDDVEALYERALVPDPAPPPADISISKTLDILLDVALPVSVSFGRTALQIREVLKLNTGSIVELNRLVSEPVDVVVNDCVIARGEVVVVDGNYGVRITHLASREDRLRSGMREATSRLGSRS